MVVAQQAPQEVKCLHACPTSRPAMLRSNVQGPCHVRLNFHLHADEALLDMACSQRHVLLQNTHSTPAAAHRWRRQVLVLCIHELAPGHMWPHATELLQTGVHVHAILLTVPAHSSFDLWQVTGADGQLRATRLRACERHHCHGQHPWSRKAGRRQEARQTL